MPAPPTNLVASPMTIAATSLAAKLGAPTFMDLFNYKSVSDAAFKKNWSAQSYVGKNYAGAGSDCTFSPNNISFPNDNTMGVPCLCERLDQPTQGTSTGVEILSVSLFGYGTYEFCSRMGCTSNTSEGKGTSISGGVSSTFLISNNNAGGVGYVEIDAPECEGTHSTWAEYDTWFNGDGAGNNSQPAGTGFHSQGSGADTYLIIPDMVSAYHYYGLVWQPTALSFYLDGLLQGSLTKNVPSPGTGGNVPVIDINHYGCNGPNWGGAASVGTTRYFYIRSAKYWKG